MSSNEIRLEELNALKKRKLLEQKEAARKFNEALTAPVRSIAGTCRVGFLSDICCWSSLCALLFSHSTLGLWICSPRGAGWSQ